MSKKRNKNIFKNSLLYYIIDMSFIMLTLGLIIYGWNIVAHDIFGLVEMTNIGALGIIISFIVFNNIRKSFYLKDSEIKDHREFSSISKSKLQIAYIYSSYLVGYFAFFLVGLMDKFI